MEVTAHSQDPDPVCPTLWPGLGPPLCPHPRLPGQQQGLGGQSQESWKHTSFSPSDVEVHTEPVGGKEGGGSGD